MGFSAFMFTKNTVRCVGLLGLLGMVFFTLSKFTKENGEGVHGLLTCKSERTGGSLELLTFEFTNSNGTGALARAGM